MANFKSTHDLKFEVAPWQAGETFAPELNIARFRIGTCHGIWSFNDRRYNIIAIENFVKGNGHFEDVLEWFYYSCKRDGMPLAFLEIGNPRLYKHLITKRGFVHIDLAKTDGPNAIKYFPTK